MPSKNENVMQEAIDFDDANLSIEDLEESLEAELESQLSGLSLLEEEREKIGNPDNLGKVIMDEVWTQFGNQIGLDMTNEALIEAYNREHPEDPEEYSKAVGDAIMQDEKYKTACKEMKQKQQEGTLTDGYTGGTMGETDKPNLDHVVPRKEVHIKLRRRQAGIPTKELANKKENLVPTNESLNKSKKDQRIGQYVKKRKQRAKTLKARTDAVHKKIDQSNKSGAEKRIEHEKVDKRLRDKLAADDKMMLKADAKARTAINISIAKGVTKQTAKKAGKDALKVMAVSALFDLLKSIMNGLVRFFREKHKSFKLFLTEMKESIRRFISRISNFVRNGVSSVIGTVLTEIFAPIVRIFKKFSIFIKQGASSFVEVVHYWTAKENKDKPISVKIAQVGKIVTAGLTAAGAIIVGELIEKALLHIPVMAVEIPLLGSLANITGIFLASLLCGVVGAIVINRIDRYISKQQINDNIHNQINVKDGILRTKYKLVDVENQKMEEVKGAAILSVEERHCAAAIEMAESLDTIFNGSDDEGDETENSEALDKSNSALKELLEEGEA